MSQEEQVLAREIIADAQKRAERIKRRAEREARKIVGDAEKQARAERDRTMQDAQQRAEHQQEVVRARIEHELEGLRREVRHQIVERTRAEAEKKLAQMANGRQHRQALGGLALLAIQAMSGDRFQLVLRAGDRDRWGGELITEIRRVARDELGRDVQLEIAADTLKAAGGLVVRSPDGRQVADQTFEARMRRLWEQISGELVSLADWARTDALAAPDATGTGK